MEIVETVEMVSVAEMVEKWDNYEDRGGDGDRKDGGDIGMRRRQL